MEIKIKNIVKLKETNEIYEVINIIGDILLCKPINALLDKTFQKYGLPLKKEDVEVMMDQETDALNILFKRESE